MRFVHSARLSRTLGALALVAGAAGSAAATVLVAPQPFFSYSVVQGRVELRSDRSFDPGLARAVLDDVARRLKASGLDDGAIPVHRAFIANAPWRERLVFLSAYGGAGVSWYPLTNNVFLREATVEADVLIGHSGRPAAAPRTLAYFLAHEIGHTLTGRIAGPVAFLRLPVWLREGSADWVAFAGTGVDDLDALARAFLDGDDRAMNPARSGLYTRYRFLFAYLVERLDRRPQDLLAHPIEQNEAEEIVRADLSRRGFAISP